MSALIASATTSLTSCKDYDDDINNLQSQIDELKTLQEKIQKQIDNGAILTSVTPTGDGVVLALSNGNSYTIKNGVNGANGTNGKDGQNGKDGKDGSVVTIGENGNWFIDGKDTKLAAKGKDGANGKDGQNGDYYVPNATTGKFDKYTYDAEKKEYVKSATDISFQTPGTITAVQDGDMLTLYGVKDAQGNDVPFVLDLSHKIASADLFLNNHEDGADAFDEELTFTSVAEKTNTFGDLKITDKVFEFKEGQHAVQGDSVLIRVNPTAVTLDKANIHLMNSQKKELDFVECTDVHRYTGLATRAAESGLWVAVFNLKSDFNEDALKAATSTKDGKILYSVSIKDSKDSDPDARIVTDYDLTLEEQGGKYADDFTVNKKSINDIHNRYTACDDQKTTSTTGVPELAWKDATKPGTKAILEGDNANAVNRPTPAVDDRQSKDILPVELGQDITIKYDADKPIKGFYVTLDNAFALESAPSELNAWSAGTYENVGVTNVEGTVVTKATMFTGNEGTIRINSSKDVGDIIGFRVYAVNLDGTLVDPDGRAFYVSLGKKAQQATLGTHDVTASVTKKGSTSEIFALNTTLENGKIEWTPSDNNPKYGADGNESPAFTVNFFEDAKGEKPVTELSKAKYAQIVFDNAANYIDNATYTQIATITNDKGNTLMTLTISAKKVLPEALVNYTLKDNQIVDDVYTCYLLPNGEADPAKWNAETPASEGTMDMTNVINFKGATDNYAVIFAETALNKETKKYDKEFPAKLKLSVASELIDNKTKHATAITYTYKGIRTYKKADGTWVVGGDYSPTAQAFQTIYADVLAYPVMKWAPMEFDSKTKKYKATTLSLNYETTGQTISLDKFVSSNAYNATKLGEKKLSELKNCYKFESVELISNVSKNADYFKADFNDAKTEIVFTPQSGTTNPTADVASTLTIKAKDVFGQPVTISVPVTVKKQ